MEAKLRSEHVYRLNYAQAVVGGQELMQQPLY